MIQVHKIKETSVFLKENEERILSLRVGPIHRGQYYLFLFIRKKNQILLRILSCSTYNFLPFAIEYDKKRCLEKRTIMEFCCDKETILEFMNRFGQEIEVADEKLKRLVKNAEMLKMDEDISIFGGLDGWSLDFHSVVQKGALHVWCLTDEKSEHYRPIIDLANYLMDMTDIDKKYRFLIYKRRSINE